MKLTWIIANIKNAEYKAFSIANITGSLDYYF